MTESLREALAVLDRQEEVVQDDFAERILAELFRNVEQPEPIVQYTPDAEPVKADWP